MTKQVRRAAIFGRTSDDDDAAERVDDQLAECRRFAERHGFEVVATYREEDVKGGLELMRRPHVMQMFTDAASGAFDLVIWRDADRLARNAGEARLLNETLAQYGVETWTTVAGHRDTRSADGTIRHGIDDVLAEAERKRIKERTARGRLRAVSEGRNPNGRTAYGLRSGAGGKGTEGIVSIDENEAHTLRRMFGWAIEGLTPYRIAALLNAEGVPARSKGRRGGKPRQWYASTVTTILRNRSYVTGEVKFTLQHPVEGEQERLLTGLATLIDEDTFEQAQAALKRNREHRHNRPVRSAEAQDDRHLYGLAGRISHAHAEDEVLPMWGWGRMRQRKLERRFYRCRLAYPDAAGTCPGLQGAARKRTAVSADEVEGRVLLWALDVLDNPKLLERYVAEADQALAGAARAELTLHEAELRRAEVDVERKRLGLAFSKGAIDEATLDAELATLDKRVVDLDGVIERQRQRDNQRQTLQVTLEELLKVRIEPVARVGLGASDVAWDDNVRLLRQHAEAAVADGEQLPEEVVAWVADLVEKLDISLVLHGIDPEDWELDAVVGVGSPRVDWPSRTSPSRRSPADRS
jgi:DNA invertase Pin-like site-specific DNA recombinase